MAESKTNIPKSIARGVLIGTALFGAAKTAGNVADLVTGEKHPTYFVNPQGQVEPTDPEQLPPNDSGLGAPERPNPITPPSTMQPPAELPLLPNGQEQPPASGHVDI